MLSTRRTILARLIAVVSGAGLLPRRLGAQSPEAAGTPAAPGFQLVATVESDAWETLPTRSATPVADEELAGPALLDALRGGGFVIYFRHARTDFSQDDTDLSDLANCATQRNLTDEGRAQARQIGEAITALEIPVGEVLSSELCRTRETAELTFGRVVLMRELSSFGTAESEADEAWRVEVLRWLLSTAPAPGTNTVLVGHQFNINRATGVSIAEGEAAIFRPLGTPNAATPVGT
jgi:phosphohistidine phosphatase SixA